MANNTLQRSTSCDTFGEGRYAETEFQFSGDFGDSLSGILINFDPKYEIDLGLIDFHGFVEKYS